MEGEHERLDSRQENEEQYDGMYTERRQKRDQDSSKETSESRDAGTSKDTGPSGDADRYEEQRNRSGGHEASDKNQNFEEEEQNKGLDLDIGDIARALENRQQIDDSSSSGIEDITAEVMAERGVFGHFLIANSQNEMMERDVEEATENTTVTD